MLNNQEIKLPVLIEDLGMQFATEKSKNKRRYGLYKCSCGKEFKSVFQDVKHNIIVSCGCYRISKSITHNMRYHALYSMWKAMIYRCVKIHHNSYKEYGGRGISVCDRWMDINNFIDDMYPSYREGLTLDRINFDGNYEPSNCRWANGCTQARNTRLIRSTNKSGYRGVHFNKQTNSWRARITISYKNIHLGMFKTALDAAKSYDAYVIENNLEHTINGVI